MEINSIAIGVGAISSGQEAGAVGEGVIASGFGSTAFGYNTNSSGAFSTTFGLETEATAGGAFATGEKSKATGQRSFVSGYNTIASGANSFAGGRDNVVSGEESFVIGRQNNISGNRSFGSGYGTIITGNDAFAFGPSARVTENYGIALGTYYTYVDESTYQTAYTIASNKGAFAIQGGEASGINSFARGFQMIVSGKDSFGINLNNESQTLSQDNTFAVVGGNSGFGTTEAKRTVHIKDVMRLEPRSTAPENASLGDIYVNNITSELCFYNGGIWIGLNGNNCEIYELSPSEIYGPNYIVNGIHFTNYYPLGGFQSLKINNEIIQVFDIVENETDKYAYMLLGIKPESFRNDLSKKVYYNETSCIIYCFKIVDLVSSSRPTVRGYIDLDFINSTEEDIQNGNNLYLGDYSNNTFIIGGIEHKIFVDGISLNQNFSLIYIDGSSLKVLYLGVSQNISGYNWTLTSLSQNRGEFGKKYINITRS